MLKEPRLDCIRKRWPFNKIQEMIRWPQGLEISLRNKWTMFQPRFLKIDGPQKLRPHVHKLKNAHDQLDLPDFRINLMVIPKILGFGIQSNISFLYIYSIHVKVHTLYLEAFLFNSEFFYDFYFLAKKMLICSKLFRFWIVISSSSEMSSLLWNCMDSIRDGFS